MACSLRRLTYRTENTLSLTRQAGHTIYQDPYLRTCYALVHMPKKLLHGGRWTNLGIQGPVHGPILLLSHLLANASAPLAATKPI